MLVKLLVYREVILKLAYQIFIIVFRLPCCKFSDLSLYSHFTTSVLFCFVFTGMFVTFSLERTARIENSIRYSLWSNLLLVCKQIAEKPVYNIRRLHVSSGLKNLRSPRDSLDSFGCSIYSFNQNIIRDLKQVSSVFFMLIKREWKRKRKVNE